MTFDEWQGLVTEYTDDVEGRLKKAKALDKFKDYIWVYYQQEIQLMQEEIKKNTERIGDILDNIVNKLEKDIEKNLKEAGTLPEGIYSVIENSEKYKSKNVVRDKFDHNSKRTQDEALFKWNAAGEICARFEIDFSVENVDEVSSAYIAAIEKDYKLLMKIADDKNVTNTRAELTAPVYNRLRENIDLLKNEIGDDAFENRKGMTRFEEILDAFEKKANDRTKSVEIGNIIMRRVTTIRNNVLDDTDEIDAAQIKKQSGDVNRLMHVFDEEKDKYDEKFSLGDYQQSFDEARAQMKTILDKQGQGTYEELQKDYKELKEISDSNFKNGYTNYKRYADGTLKSVGKFKALFSGMDKKMKKAGFESEQDLKNHLFTTNELNNKNSRELYVYRVYLNYVDALNKISTMENPLANVDRSLTFEERAMYLNFGPDVVLRNAIDQLAFSNDNITEAEREKFKPFLNKITEDRAYVDYLSGTLASDFTMVEDNLAIISQTMNEMVRQKINLKKLQKESAEKDGEQKNQQKEQKKENKLMGEKNKSLADPEKSLKRPELQLEKKPRK